MIVEAEKPNPTDASIDRAEASALIKNRALQLGFQRVGIVRAEALNEEAARLQQWLARGFHGEMKWMEREPQQRTDPGRIFPAARSVIVVALNYYTPHQHHVSIVRVSGSSVSTGSGSNRIERTPGVVGTLTGKVSRYAWGHDYHEIAGEKLRELLSWTKAQWPQTEGKVCVDIQPMMDKAWAERAGLGWIGKHTNLITPEYGSWVFIGELLLSIELEYDHQRIEDHCGSCTLCIDACPTQAITEPYVVDSNKCISYATIELRDAEIPSQVSDNLEGWLYGCDICLDVCPWNRFEQLTAESRFQP